MWWPQGIGNGQTWQNVTAIRSAYVNYTNNTDRPIKVVVSASSTSGTANNAYLYVSGVAIAAQAISFGGSGALMGHVDAIVPAGAIYSFNPTGAAAIWAWAELR